MGNQPSSSNYCSPYNFTPKLTKEQLDEQCKPSGLYNSCPWSDDAIRRLITSGQVAQISIGSEFPSSEEDIHCPICFLYHPVSNRTKCCSASICTECYLQARPQKLPKHKDTGKQIPPTCPFCKNSSKKFKVTPYSNICERDSSTLQQNSSHSVSDNDELRTERRSWFQKNRPPLFEQDKILFDAKIRLPVSQSSTATTTTTSTSSLSCEQICDSNDCRSAASSNNTHCDLYQFENEIKLLHVEQPRNPESYPSSQDGTYQRDLLLQLGRSTYNDNDRFSSEHTSFLVNSNNNEDSRILEAAILLSIKEQEYMEQEARRLQQEEEDILAESTIAISRREDELTVIPISEDEQLRIAIEASLNDPKESAYAVSPHSVTHTSSLDYLNRPSMERLPHCYGQLSNCHRPERKHELPLHQLCHNHQPENSSVQRMKTEYHNQQRDVVSAYDTCRHSSNHSPYPQNTTYNSNRRNVGGRDHIVHRNNDIDRTQQNPRRSHCYYDNDSDNFDSEHDHRYNSSTMEQYCAPNKQLTSRTSSQVGISKPDWQPQHAPYQRPLQSHLQSGSNDVNRYGQKFR